MNPVVRRLTQRIPEVLRQPADLPSPCQSVCVMDDTRGWCTGCLRTLPEIASWGSLNDHQKRLVWSLIGERSQNL
jgi:predicted Fe-S protein YdhL (DUF1289 family)